MTGERHLPPPVPVEPPEVRINLRLVDLQRHRVDVRELARRLESNNFEQSLGVLRGDELRHTLRTTSPEQGSVGP